MIKWIRTSRLSIQNSLSGQGHEAVQKMLVAMGDKPPRFVGSKQVVSLGSKQVQGLNLEK